MADSAEERLLPSSELVSSGDDFGLRSRVWTESKKIWRIAFPGIIARVTSFGTIVMTQLFLGHVSSLALAAFALEQTVFLRFINGIMIGMSSATETLCGQAFGAGQTHMMGVYLQRSWLVNAVTVTICMPVFIFTKQILVGIGQNASIAAVAGEVSLWFIPYNYSFVFAFSIQMFLQAQMKNKIIGWLTVPSFVLHVALSWLLVIKLDLGIAGAMIPLLISTWSIVIGEIVYLFCGWCRDSWKGFSKAAFSDLWPVIKLSVSSGVMLCLELWYNSILVLLAGYMSDAAVEISAFSICLNINGWQFMICLGFLAAASVRVSNELGKGNAAAAKFAIKVTIVTSVSLGVILFVLCLLFDKQVAYLFTIEEAVANEISHLSVLLAFSMLLNSIQAVLNGIAVGSGMQSLVAIVNLGSYYLLGLPIGACLAYLTDLKVMGLWIGLLTGISIQVLFVAFIVWRCDWDAQVEKASSRLKTWYIKPDEVNVGSSNGGAPA